jgi:endonuclease/exonuclease/phosphatase family metal-dependent hydrolase
MLLASRYPIESTEIIGRKEMGGHGVIVRYDLRGPAGVVHFFNLHFETPRDGLQAVIAGAWNGAGVVEADSRLRRDQSNLARQWVARASGPVVVAGDFNMPVDSAIYRDHWSNFTDAFSAAGWGFGYSYGRTRKFGWWVRLDHVLASSGWKTRHCWVGPDVGSDHRPVLVELVGRSGGTVE